MDLKLDGHVALVTGGSKGIGKATALALAQEGADIALVARDQATLNAAAEELRSRTGRRIETFSIDSGVDEQVKHGVAAVLAAFGAIDILINSAAMPAGQGPAPKLADITDQNFWADVNIKVMGYLRFIREVAPAMQARGSGRIVNVSGLAARQTGSIIGSIRNISVAALTKNVADELGPDGISAICVHPGMTRTEKSPAVFARQAEAAGVGIDIIEKRMADLTSIRHLVTAEEVADVIAFLASPRSVAISGDAIAVGGGKPGAIYY